MSAPADEDGEIRVRPAREGDAELLARIRFDAVRAVAAAFYPAEVMQCWAPEPSAVASEELRRAIASESEAWMVAEREGSVVGFGAIAPSERAVRGVYVAPGAVRRGVGSRVLAELERAALARGVSALEIAAPLNAEKFFARHGYRVAGRHIERFGSAKLRMACLKMHKTLSADATAGSAAPTVTAPASLRFLSVHPIGDTDPLGLPIRDVGPAIGYYTCVLGFRLVSKTADAAVLARDAVRIGLAVNGKDPEQASCYFEVTDVAALHRELSNKGIEPSALREERQQGQPQRIFFAKEPFGVCFCFGQTGV